ARLQRSQGRRRLARAVLPEPVPAAARVDARGRGAPLTRCTHPPPRPADDARMLLDVTHGLEVRIAGLALRLWEAHDGRSRAYWCRRDGYVVRLVTPPLCGFRRGFAGQPENVSRLVDFL